MAPAPDEAIARAVPAARGRVGAEQGRSERGVGVKSYRVEPGSRVSLADWDPEDHTGFDGGKKKGMHELSRLRERLDELQALLYAEHRHKVLVVLQAMDAGGKDGTIRSVFGA